MRRLSGLSVLAGAALVAAAALARPGSAAATVVYFAAGALSTAAVFLAVRRHRPPPSPVWTLARAALPAFLVSGIVEAAARGAVLPDPTPLALVTLPAYLLVAAIVVALVRSVGPGELALTDVALATVASAALLWSVAVEPNVALLPRPDAAVSLLFTFADLSLLALLMRVAFSPLARVPAFRCLAASLIVLFVSDAVSQMPQLAGGGLLRAIGTCYVAAFVLAALAALDPSMRRLVTSTTRASEPSPGRTVALVTLALLSLPAGLGIQQGVAHAPDLPAFALLGALVVGLVAVRVGRVLTRFERLRLQAEASEQRFRMVFESAAIGISIGRGGMLTEPNPALQRMLGYDGDELSRLHYRDVTCPDDIALDDEADRLVLSGRVPSYSYEKRYVRKDGTVVPAEVTLSLARDGSFGIALVEDISTRKALEEELRQAQKMDAVGKLAGGIAHDFNNLLTVVGGHAEILARELPDADPRRAAVDEVAKAAARAADLTRQLLAFSRRQVLRPEPVDLADVVAGVETLLRRLLPENVLLVLDVRPGAVAQVDRAQLEQVVLNLVLNARDALPAGGTLVLRARGEGGDALLAVEDDGVGMDEATRRRIFEPFFTTKPVGSGTGLGLSTVEGIVAQSGGSVAVETAPGRGAAFTVRLPLARPAPLAPPPRPPAPAPTGAGVVLLAEDEELVRRVTASMLERGGYRVVEAPSGEEALDRLEAGLVPDVLVSDVVMTGIGGPALAERARRLVPSLPVLFISGYAPAALGGDPPLGGAEILEKPFGADELVSRVAALRLGLGHGAGWESVGAAPA